jgi:hypothetical protein
MRLWPKPRTDEGYVELVRKRMSHRRTFVALHICTALLFLLLFLLYVAFLSWFLSRIPKDMEQLFAVIDGKMAGWSFFFGGCCLILGVRVLRGARAARLMIQFHGELGPKPCDGNLIDPSSRQPGSARRTLTDEQYVTCIRKGMAWIKWISLVYFCVAAVCLSMSLVALRGHWAALNVYAPEGAWRSLAVGLSAGALKALAVAGFAGSLGSAGQCIFNQRAKRLMLRFHDERRLTEGQQEAPSQNAG